MTKKKVQDTIINLTNTLRQILNNLNEDPDLELKEFKDIENLIEDLEDARVESRENIGNIYSLRDQKLSQTNIFFDFDKALEDTIEHVESVKAQPTGSKEQTIKAKSYVQESLKCLGVLAKDAQAFIYEKQLSRLFYYVNKLRREHPIRKLYEKLSNELRDSWSKGYDQTQFHLIFSFFG